MDNVQPQQRTKRSSDVVKAELERVSRNLWKVYNPTNQDFQVILNAAISPEIWTIQAREEAVVPYYVAQKYWEEMTNKIIYNKADKDVIDENNRREQVGHPKMDLHTEQYRFENRILKGLLSKREQIVQALNRGLYKEYGIEKTEMQNIDARYAKETFDPGDVLGGAPVATPKQAEPVTAPSPVVNNEAPQAVVAEEDEPEEGEVSGFNE